MNDYRGRFAPTPSGPLHFGSLFAAVVSYLDAKAHHGTWLVRIDDLDPPREALGATAAILRTLETHGLHWDESVSYQSQHFDRYQQRLDELADLGRIFWCDCSRKKLTGQHPYPGFCREQRSIKAHCAARFRVLSQADQFTDIFQGEQQAQVAEQFGDVILKRRDQLFAYQLAVVSDDIAQNISHVIRGIDLMDSTFWQRELYRALKHKPPVYGHFAVLHAPNSKQKLSKQNLAKPIDDNQTIENLLAVFNLLSLNIATDSPAAMLEQATQRWQRQLLIGQQQLTAAIF